MNTFIKLLFLSLVAPQAFFFMQSCTSTLQSNVTGKIILPRGWFLSQNNSKVTLIKAEEKKPGYTLLFDRSNDFKEAAYYVHLAESIYPEKFKIQSTEKISDSKLNSWYFDRLWWFEEYRDYRIPYSITGDTVNFYILKYRNFKQRLRKLSSGGSDFSGTQNRVEFLYTAKVVGNMQSNAEGTSVEAKNVEMPVRVILTMRWFEYCGQPCGWGFEKSREVIFASKKRIAEIKGDGFTQKWVSTKENPYAKDQWITF